MSQSVQTQIGQIDLRRQNVIELKNPGEFLAADEQAHRTFYRQSKQEIGSLLEKLDAVREKQQTSGDKSEENALKKQLNQIKEAKPNFAYKLENSAGDCCRQSVSQSTRSKKLRPSIHQLSAQTAGNEVAL